MHFVSDRGPATICSRRDCGAQSEDKYDQAMFEFEASSGLKFEKFYLLRQARIAPTHHPSTRRHACAFVVVMREPVIVRSVPGVHASIVLYGEEGRRDAEAGSRRDVPR